MTEPASLAIPGASFQSPLAAKKVVIIGGSSGIGLATARGAAGRGAEVVIAARSEAKLVGIAESIEGNIRHHTLDVRDARTLDACFEIEGPFDHLVVTAVELNPRAFLELQLDEARQTFDTKFWGQFSAAQLAAPCIRDGGSITLFSGVTAMRPVPGLSAIAAANGAVEALARSLAVELRPIRVNAVAPGFVDTHEMPEERRSELAAKLPVGRVGHPDDVASLVIQLMENPYVTGGVFRIDGGHSLV